MIITTNGTNIVSLDPGQEYVLFAAGTFGGGTLTPKWSDGTTDVTVVGPSGDLALTSGAAYVLVAPTSSLKFVLAGATGASINIDITETLQ